MELNFEIDHIGIAVHSLEEGFKLYRSMGWEKMDIEEVLSEGVRVGFIRFANRSSVELLEPLNEDSVIAHFLKKQGSGVHHICYGVKNIESVMSGLKSSGFRLLDEKPRDGAHNCKVCFIHPKSAGGVLIELSEKKV